MFKHHHPQQNFPTGFFHSPFRPAKALKNAHLQTLFASVHRRKPLSIKRERETILLSDGDHLFLDFHYPSHETVNSPLVLVIHGLSGSSVSHYVIGLQKSLATQGIPSVAMNCRGSIQANHAVRAYHAGASDDVRDVFTYLTEHQARPIIIVGYSLGGSMTLKTLSELGKHPRLLAGVAVSTPLELAPCANRLDAGISIIYRQYLLNGLHELWQKKYQHFLAQDDTVALQRLDNVLQHAPFKSFWQFDDLLMAPLHGFANVDDYYQRCRPNQFLSKIQVPTLVIHALDDPFMSVDVIPAEHALSPQIRFELAKHGGHVGFIGGSLQQPEYYLESRIPAFINSILSP